jgi:hypothetical protein
MWPPRRPAGDPAIGTEKPWLRGIPGSAEPILGMHQYMADGSRRRVDRSSKITLPALGHRAVTGYNRVFLPR